METYWKDLVSTSLRVFQDQNNTDSIFVIKNSTLAIEFNNHDNWNGGIDYWDIVFQLNYHDFTVLGEKRTLLKVIFSPFWSTFIVMEEIRLQM